MEVETGAGWGKGGGCWWSKELGVEVERLEQGGARGWRLVVKEVRGGG